MLDELRSDILSVKTRFQILKSYDRIIPIERLQDVILSINQIPIVAVAQSGALHRIVPLQVEGLLFVTGENSGCLILEEIHHCRTLSQG